MFEFLLSVPSVVVVFFRSHAEASLEVLALRQQVAVLKRKRPRPTPGGTRRSTRPQVTRLVLSSAFAATGCKKRGRHCMRNSDL
jgi:hypothetical protein